MSEQPPTKKRPKKKDDFVRGFACAAAIVAREDGFVGNGMTLLKSGGFYLAGLAALGVDESDIEALEQDANGRRRSTL